MAQFDITFIIATKNQGKTIQDNIQRILNQKYKGKIEILIVDDKSDDDSEDFIKSLADGKQIIFMSTLGKGRVKGLNKAIKKARGEYICLSAGDIFYKNNFVSTILKYFTEKSIAFVSPFSETGGNATVWKTNILKELNGFDEGFNEKGTGFRDDTDLAFRAFDKGYTGVFTYKTANFEHEHSIAKKNIKSVLKYGWSRMKIHRFDPLLFKKHPKRGKEFFDVKLGFIRNPKLDFFTATGMWKGKFDFSSPQGVVLVRGNKGWKKIVIILLGILYVIGIKCVRFYGSIKYGKLLI